MVQARTWIRGVAGVWPLLSATVTAQAADKDWKSDQIADALRVRGLAAFDELRQGIGDIEFLDDPYVGELTIGCPEAIAAGS